jgi:hypothetical protein
LASRRSLAMQQLGLHLLTPDPYAGKHPRIISFAAVLLRQSSGKYCADGIKFSETILPNFSLTCY